MPLMLVISCIFLIVCLTVILRQETKIKELEKDKKNLEKDIVKLALELSEPSKNVLDAPLLIGKGKCQRF
jgi:peptidoglycan hydrolase CwlO-like protein